jgi:hypothetical protein
MRIASLVLVLAACTTRPSDPPDAASPDAPDAPPAPDAGGCGCSPGIHNDRILLMSDEAELWSFDPQTLEMALVRARVCGGTESPFSMAIDARGRGYVVFVESRAVRTFDLAAPTAPCEAAPFDPSLAGFGLFGMAFASDPVTTCERLYLHSYSGSGPFDEGPGAGVLGEVDVESGVTRELSAIDFDGGELGGTGDGQLFALAGLDPAKIVEYDRATGAVLEIVPLSGFSKTGASAMSFFAGDLYLFTEALPVACETCMEASCAADRDACTADAACAAQLACYLETARESDACGGGIPAPLLSCVSSTCGESCLRAPRDRTSQVTRLDWDGDRSLERVVREGPIRVVGAGASTCVQTIPF